MGRARLAWWIRMARETGETEPAKILAKAKNLTPMPLFDGAAAAETRS